MDNLSHEELVSFDIDHFMDSRPSRLNAYLFRLGACLLCLLLVWVTSAPVTNSLISYSIPAPTLSQVIDRWSVLSNAWTAESFYQMECSERAYQSYASSAKDALAHYRQNLDDAIQSREQALHLSASYHSSCSLPFTAVVSQFHTHAIWGGHIEYNETACSSQQIDHLKSILKPSSLDILSSELNILQASWTETLNSYQQTLQQGYNQSRQFLLSATTPVSFISQASPLIGTRFTQIAETVALLRTVSVPVDDAFDMAWAPIQKSLEQALSFFGNARTLIVKFGNALGSKVSLPPIDQIIPLDPLTSFPSKLQSSFVVMMARLEQSSADVASSIITDLQTETQELEQAFFHLGDIIYNTIASFDGDYNPPPLSLNLSDIYNGLKLNMPSDLINDWSEKASSLVTNSQVVAKEQAQKIISSFASIPKKLSNITLPRLDSLDWAIGKILGAVGPVISLCNTLWKILVIFDIVYRVEASLKTIFFYGKTSVSQLPLLDLRRDAEDLEYFDLLGRIPWSLIGPLLSIALLAILILVLTIVFVIRYVMLYDSYVKGCVVSTDGTFLTQTTFNIAKNLLNDTSNLTILAQEQRYTQEFYGACQSEHESFQANYTSSENEIVFQKQDYLQNLETLALITKCIDPHATYTYPLRSPQKGDIEFYLAVNPTEALNETKLVNSDTIRYLAATGCSAHQLEKYPWNGLEDRLPSAESCLQNIPMCDIRSSCPLSFDAVHTASHYSGCDSEWYIHSIVIKLFLTMLVMICLNVMRVFVMKFITTFFFRELGTVNLEVLLNYKFRTVKCTVPDDEIKKEIKLHVKAHKKSAFQALGIAIVSQIPYLFALFFFLKFSAPMR